MEEQRELSLKELSSILNETIKMDDRNKVITFLTFLSAYTEDSQINIMNNAPSSSGKSYVPLEISKLFPDEDMMKISHATPAAFFHDQTSYDKENKVHIVDLRRKILIFLDQPHTELLKRLRPLFSHDERIIKSKITDKSSSGGNRTKTVWMYGFPAVVFCSAGLKFDEQEANRFILLSPDIHRKKIELAIKEKVKKEKDTRLYESQTKKSDAIKSLKDRILDIKNSGVKHIIIKNPEVIESYYLSKDILKVRFSRDIGRLFNLIKATALLNFAFRERQEDTIHATEDDIEQTMEIWRGISKPQEFNMPPFVYDFYEKVLKPMEQKIDGDGMERTEIRREYKRIIGENLACHKLSREILPMLEDAGLIEQHQDPDDKRRYLVYLNKIV